MQQEQKLIVELLGDNLDSIDPVWQPQQQQQQPKQQSSGQLAEKERERERESTGKMHTKNTQTHTHIAQDVATSQQQRLRLSTGHHCCCCCNPIREIACNQIISKAQKKKKKRKKKKSASAELSFRELIFAHCLGLCRRKRGITFLASDDGDWAKQRQLSKMAVLCCGAVGESCLV